MRNKTSIRRGFVVLSSDNYDLFVQIQEGEKFMESEKGIANERYTFFWGETTVHIALIFLTFVEQSITNEIAA